MDRVKLAMDRAWERLVGINTALIGLLERWNTLSKAEAKEAVEKILGDYANIITQAHPDYWRMLARRDGVVLPEDEQDDQT